MFRKYLKVSKSQKQFFLKLGSLKLGQNFVDYFVRFGAMESQEKMVLRFTDLSYQISNILLKMMQELQSLGVLGIL